MFFESLVWHSFGFISVYFLKQIIIIIVIPQYCFAGKELWFIYVKLLIVFSDKMPCEQ